MARNKFFVSLAVAAALTFAMGEIAHAYILSPFYAIQSSTEYNGTKSFLNANSQHMYFQWARISRNTEGTMVFTNKYNSSISQYDSYVEYGFPGALNMDDFKASTKEKGKALLSVFLNDTLYADGKNSTIEFLNMSPEQWRQNIIDPLLDMLNNKDNKLKYAFDGVVLDFEGFRNNYTYSNYSDTQQKDLKVKYNSFLKLLKEALETKELVVCINPTNVSGYFDGYDYSYINTVADYILLMAYGYEHITDSYQIDISETQPYKKVEQAVDELISKHNVSADKVILGLDLTAIKWIKLKKNDNGQDSTYYAMQKRFLEDVEKLPAPEEYLTSSKITKKTLDKSQILQSDKSEFEKNGVTIEQVEYLYESPRSLYEKYYSIVSRYGLAGVSSWRLGTGSVRTWRSLAEMFNTPEDLNKDSKVDTLDLSVFSRNYGKKTDFNSFNDPNYLITDLNFDGVTDVYDLVKIYKLLK